MNCFQRDGLLWKLLYNAFRFLITLGFVFLFQYLFGPENTLIGVAIGVGFTMLPLCDLGIRPWTMFGITLILYIGSAIVAQLTLLHPLIAFLGNFLFTSLIILLSNEPVIMKSNISFLLCFVFAQSTVVPWDLFPNRLWATTCGALFVGCCIVVHWYRHGYGTDGVYLRQQIQRCQYNRSYLLRMSFGISIAMLTGTLFQLKKPLWISVVVMSLTQLEFSETIERIIHRFVGTFIGIILFFIFFQILIPKQYAALLVMLLGYLGYFFPDYKYKQVINAISALNASLVLLDTKTAIEHRVLCLLAGIIVVLFIYVMTIFIKKCHFKLLDYIKQRWNHSFPERDTQEQLSI